MRKTTAASSMRSTVGCPRRNADGYGVEDQKQKGLWMSVLEADRSVMKYQCEEVISRAMDAARQAVCSAAHTPSEAREFLLMLGLLDDVAG